MVTKVTIVADTGIHEYLSDMYKEWDTQMPVNSLKEFWDLVEEEKISFDTDIVIFSDQYLDRNDTSEFFEQTIATFAEGCLTMILAFGGQATESYLSAKVAELQALGGKENAPIYYVDTNAPEESINAALAEHVARGGENYAVALPTANSAEYSVSSVPEEQSVAPTQQRNGMIVTSTASKGGSGKTSTALLLAAQLVKSSQKSVAAGKVSRPLDVCVVDMDTRDGQIGFLIGQLQPTSLNIRVHPNWDQDVIRQNLVFDSRLGIHALLAPKRARTADDVPPEFYRKVITELKHMFDVVILDTSVNYLDPLLSELCYPIADAILFVTDLGITSVFGMTRWFQESLLEVEKGGIGLDPRKIGVVVNKSMGDINMGPQRVSDAAMGTEMLTAIPSRPQEFFQAANNNRLDILLQDPEIGTSFYQLARKIIGNSYPLEPLVTRDDSAMDKAAKTARATASTAPRKPAVMPTSRGPEARPVAKVEPVKKRGFLGRR